MMQASPHPAPLRKQLARRSQSSHPLLISSKGARYVTERVCRVRPFACGRIRCGRHKDRANANAESLLDLPHDVDAIACAWQTIGVSTRSGRVLSTAAIRLRELSLLRQPHGPQKVLHLQ